MIAVSERRTAAGWAAHNARMRDLAIERGGATLAVLDAERLCFRVPSSSVAGRSYDVRVDAAGGLALVTCNCPAGSSQSPLGSAPCHHGAAGCLAMEAARLLAWTGSMWTRAFKPDVRNPCGACGQEVDLDALIPVERQAVRVDGELRHRKCAG